MAQYIDSHVHLWRLARGDYGWLTPSNGVLYQDYEMEQLKPLLAQHGVAGVVVVQAAPTLEETAFLLELAEQHPEIVGVVGFADLAAEDAAAAIAWLAQQPKLSGIRLDARFVKRYNGGDKAQMLARLAELNRCGLTVDWLGAPGSMEVLLACLRELPELTVIVNHVGAPDLSAASADEAGAGASAAGADEAGAAGADEAGAAGAEAGAGASSTGAAPVDDTWFRHMRELATYPNVAVKLSGMLTQGDDSRPLRHVPYVHALAELFGAERLMFGSDWPVVLLRGSYAASITLLEQLLPEAWEEAAKDAVRRQNALRIYGKGYDHKLQ